MVAWFLQHSVLFYLFRFLNAHGLTYLKQNYVTDSMRKMTISVFEICICVLGIMVNIYSGKLTTVGSSVVMSLLKSVSDVLVLDGVEAAQKIAGECLLQNGDNAMVSDEECGKPHKIDIGQVLHPPPPPQYTMNTCIPNTTPYHHIYMQYLFTKARFVSDTKSLIKERKRGNEESIINEQYLPKLKSGNVQIYMIV